MSKNKIINVQGHTISISQINDKDFISLTDLAKDFGGSDQIKNWIRTRRTVEFLGTWEVINNPNFNMVGFHHVMYESGSEKFIMSPTQWIERTNGIGIIAKSGRFGGGTIAHKDIAFEFCSWLSPQFKLYLITEFQRLKEVENNQYNLEWNVKRILSKSNYTLQTDAIKDHIIPISNYTKDKEWIVYANEVDILNVALFGCTAKAWKENNPALALKGGNLRDCASINELAVLSNIESLNSILIKKSVDKETRFKYLKDIAKEQLVSLNKVDFLKTLKYTSESVYIDNLNTEKKNNLGDFDKVVKKFLNTPPPPKKEKD